MTEEANCYECDTPLTTICPQCNALSAAPSPTEDEVERVARALYDATPFKETAGGYDQQSDTYKRMCELLARAAIAAMRPTSPEPPE